MIVLILRKLHHSLHDLSQPSLGQGIDSPKQIPKNRFLKHEANYAKSGIYFKQKDLPKTRRTCILNILIAFFEDSKTTTNFKLKLIMWKDYNPLLIIQNTFKNFRAQANPK